MRPPRTIRRRIPATFAVAVATALTAVSFAGADVVTNSLDTSIDPAKETMNLTAGGAVGTTHLFVQNVNTNNPLPYSDPSSGSYTDTNNSCNLNGSNFVTVALTSSDTSVATVTPKVKIDDCAGGGTNATNASADPNAKQITVTPGSIGGTATITASIIAAESTYSGVINTNSVDFTVNVSSVAVNQPPTANAGGPYSGAEGSSIALSGSGSDTDGTVASYAWAYSVTSADSGASCAFSSATVTAPTITCTDDGTYEVSLITTDDDGATSTASTANVTVANENPTATKSFDASAVEGSSFSLALTGGSDPGTNDTLSYEFDCGDGNGYTASATASTSCPTSDNGTRSVGAKILDDDGGVSEYTDTVTVSNAAPVVGTISFSGANCTPTASFSFTDAGTADTHKASVNWGDSTSSGPAATFATLSQPVSFTKPANYTAGDPYTVTATVQDDDLDSDTETATYTPKNIPSAILQPINTDGTRSQFKLGSTIPVKITVADCGGNSVGTLSPVVSVVRLDPDPNDPNTVIETPFTATPTNGQNMRYDSLAQQYIYNLGTKTLTQGTWKISVADGSFVAPTTATVNIKK